MSRKELQELQYALKTMKEGVEPDLDWMQSDRSALLSHIEGTMPAAPEGMSGVAKTVVGKLFPREAIQLIRGPVVAALSVLIFVTGGSIASVSASERSLPGDFLYPVKIAAEQTRLVLTTNKSDRLRLKTEFVERRVQEIKTVAESDAADKQERVKVAAEGLKRDLDTVNHQLEEVRDSSAKDSVVAAKLLDKKSTDIAKELKSVKATLPAEAKKSVSDAEAAAVNTSVKAVGVLIESKKNPESEHDVTDDELMRSISDKVNDIEAGLAETANKLQVPLEESEETASSDDGGEAEKTAETTETTEGQSEPVEKKDSILAAEESLSEARRLLENNELDEIPEKLLLAVKAAREAEQEAADQGEEAPAEEEPTSEPTEPATSTESSIENQTDTYSTSTPETDT